MSDVSYNSTAIKTIVLLISFHYHSKVCFKFRLCYCDSHFIIIHVNCEHGATQLLTILFFELIAKTHRSSQ